MTIRELAAIAGVSRTSISRALNNAPGVSVETRERVVKLAKEHGYNANPMVTALMSDVRRRRMHENRSIMAIVPPAFQDRKWGTGHIANRLYREGVESRAKQLGFKVEDFMPFEYGGSYKRVSQVLYQRGIQAVLVPSVDVVNPPDSHEYSLDWDKFSVAGIGFSVDCGRYLDRSVVSHFQAASLAFARARELGYRRIGCGLCGRINDRTQGRWLAAYLLDREMHGAGKDLPFFEFDETLGEGERLKRWFKQTRPDAIVGDRYFLELALESGLRIPEDVAFALFDWLPGELGGDDYAGIDQRFDLVGAAAVDLVASRINSNERGLPKEPKVLKVLGEWVEGRSMPPNR
ncbi:LacI family DNA-binding transcriptional regulator [Pelagicoccus sp. SDUM812005]|uniref:LacI family DNA-binding transcriptional regulator n=1 Tax=Pelagicoccus sp. SDUM812005 TaxID=3041257 RepID=UPI0028100C2E|nr:LacI family DNA-binding transcriptional regulator [Pelagicoccus sp. SDUM812005]MDQ8183524.1 LacI family DNA-binding transcriptional regulator [Pelagicoccus sp. SDUM812005]